MKRFIASFLILILLVTVPPTQAETWYVYTKNGKTLNLRDENTNKVIGNIPYGAELEPDSEKSTEKSAYVTYKGVSGFVSWAYLQRNKPHARESSKVRTASSGTLYQGNRGGAGQGQTDGFEITALGAYIQYADNRNKGAGEKWETLRVSAVDNIVITTDIPRGKKIDYWVINGIRYDFSTKVKSIRLTKADADFLFEVVHTKSESSTLISPQSIQDSRTGELLLIKTIHAKLCHINRRNKGAGGWMTSFDFTEDYRNLATKETEDGGQITAKVKAVIPKNQRIRGWKFNETELYPNTAAAQFIVRTLNTSMTYEPIFGKIAKKPKPKPTPTPHQFDTHIQIRPPITDPPPTEIYYSVNCTDCTFSGGGYTNATSGKVPKGTKITVHANYGDVDRWTINGSLAGHNNLSFSKTVKSDLNIVCIEKIN